MKISTCGLDCADCPAYLAYKKNDNKLREKTAKKWAKLYNAPGIKPEHINCLGCLSQNKPLYKHCLECKVRLCGIKKSVKNCGECKEYQGCEIVASLHKEISEGKAICDAIRKKVEKNV